MHKDAEACFDQRQNQQIIDLRWSQNSDSRSELLKKISLEDLQSWVYLFSDSELNGPVTLLSLSLFQICETLIIPDPSLIQISRSSLSSWAGLQSISNWVHYRSQHHKCLPSAGDFQEVLTLAANDVWLPMFTTAEYTEIIEDTGFLEKLQPVAACATGGLRSSSVWLVPDQWNIETISLPCGSVSESFYVYIYMYVFVFASKTVTQVPFTQSPKLELSSQACGKARATWGERMDSELMYIGSAPLTRLHPCIIWIMT